jgi:hypothetical protein
MVLLGDLRITSKLDKSEHRKQYHGTINDACMGFLPSRKSAPGLS